MGGEVVNHVIDNFYFIINFRIINNLYNFLKHIINYIFRFVNIFLENIFKKSYNIIIIVSILLSILFLFI